MFSTIKAKLITIFIVLGIIPLLFFGFLSYHTASNALLRQAQEQLGNVADKTAQQIDSFFEAAQKDIELLSKYPFIQLSFLQYEFGQRSDTIREMLRNYEKKDQYFNRIYLINADGKKILAEPETPNDPEDFKSFEWFNATMENDIYMSDLVMSIGFSTPAIVLSKLVYDFEDQTKVVGMLVFDIKATAFTQFVSSFKFGTQGYAFLFGRDDNVIYHPAQHLLAEQDLMHNGDHQLRLLLNRITNREKGSGDYLWGEIEKKMVFTPCRIKDWSVVLTVQKAELMADILKLKNRMITFFLVFLLLILVVSTLFVKSITHPIGFLIAGARAIGNGDLFHVIEIESGDELQGVAKEFNQMAAKLRCSMNEIMELTTFKDDILRSVTSGIITTDKEGRIISINESAKTLLGIDSTLLNRECLQDAPEQVKEVVDLLRKTLSNKKQLQNQEVMFLGDSIGGQQSLDVNTSLFRSSNGDIIGAIADIRDVTRRKRIEEQMVRVDKLASLGQLSAGMAHEIRNPLSGIKTSAQYLATKMDAGPEAFLIQGILSEIDRINKIVTDLLHFSLPSLPVLSPTDIFDVLEKAVGMMGEEIRKAHVQLVRNYERDIPHAIIDQEQIQQVILNLLLNAVKAMPNGGQLTISIEAISGRSALVKNIPDPEAVNQIELMRFIAVSFQDTGKGIGKAELSKVFDPFYTTDPRGTGLGLSIVQKLMEKNRGYIKLDSTPGKGTLVTLLIPASPPALEEMIYAEQSNSNCG